MQPEQLITVGTLGLASCLKSMSVLNLMPSEAKNLHNSLVKELKRTEALMAEVQMTILTSEQAIDTRDFDQDISLCLDYLSSFFSNMSSVLEGNSSEEILQLGKDVKRMLCNIYERGLLLLRSEAASSSSR